MQILEHYIGLRETISQDLPPIGYQTAYNFINFIREFWIKNTHKNW